LPWYLGALGELKAALASQQVNPTGSAVGRVASRIVPAVELATIAHQGSHANIDVTYGALATYVTQHALAVEGPLREYYLVGPHETADAAFPCERAACRDRLVGVEGGQVDLRPEEDEHSMADLRSSSVLSGRGSPGTFGLE
jgi:hypothetical protein